MANELARWLDTHGLGAHREAFAKHEIDLDILDALTERDLAELGLSIGARKRFMRAVRDWVGGTAVMAATYTLESPSVVPAAEAGTTAEHRHMTVMFCDLVDSTSMSERLDPESLRDVISSFRDACAEVVASFEGFLANYLGDGILVYFGYPQAREHDAERAVLAGLAMIDAVDTLETTEGGKLSIRVGIASGHVVAGDLVGQSASESLSVLGDTPNLAARLQSIAAPNTVIVSDQTRRLVDGRFEMDTLGRQSLKGMSEPVAAWKVLARIEGAGRLGTAPGDVSTALVGREEEINLFTRRWQQARTGEGQVILLTAEAGVGKSRVLASFIDGIRGENPQTALYFCSPFHRNSALYPVIGQIADAAGLAKDDSPAARLDKLEELLEEVDLLEDETAALFAEMHGLPAATRYRALELPPQRKRARTFDAIIRFLKAVAARAPTLAVFEDVHWVDPTTQELLGQMIDRLREDRVLLVVTFRPEFSPPWSGRANVTLSSLNHLGRADSADIVTAVAGKPLPDDVVDLILDRTDGVPLFIEELTKNLLDSGYLEEGEDRFTLPQPLPALAIPESLHDSLLARLDTLAAAKELAQVGAVIGRQFPHDLLAAISPLRAEVLDNALDKLVGSGLVSRQGFPPDASYEFKHALIQDAAYESLLRSRRRDIHGAIAEALEGEFRNLAEGQPEILAHHFSAATRADKAVAYWQSAATLALERSANREAIAHARNGLEQLEAWPDGDDKHRAELGLQLTLGPALMRIHGYSSAGVMDAYSRAVELAKGLGDKPRLFTAMWGQWLALQQGGNIEQAGRLADEVLALAEELKDTEFRLQAHHAVWTTAYRQGRIADCRLHAERGLELFDIDAHSGHAAVYGGHDAGCCALNHAALTSWFQGQADQAVEHSEAGVVLSDKLAQPFSQALVRCFAALLYRYRGEPGRARACAKDALEISDGHGFAQLAAQAEIVQGWAVALEGNTDEGLAIMNKGLDGLVATGAGPRRGTFLPIIVDVHLRRGDTQAAMEALDLAATLIEESGERTVETEVYVLRGLTLEAAGAPTEEVEACLIRALETARASGAVAIELRAATALAQVWKRADREIEALQLLSPIHAAFKEGFETPDYKAAEFLLGDLRTSAHTQDSIL